MGPAHLTAQHHHFMAQHQDLRVLRGLALAQQDQPAEHPAHDQIQQTDRHEPRSCLTPPTPANRSSTAARRVLKRYKVSRRLSAPAAPACIRATSRTVTAATPTRCSAAYWSWTLVNSPATTAGSTTSAPGR